MPYGLFNPLAKTADCSALPSEVVPRNTRMRPASLSARKISPFGAVRRKRGLSRPEAQSSTLKPSSATGHALSGSGYHLGAILRRLCRIRLRQIIHRNLADCARLLVAKIRERCSRRCVFQLCTAGCCSRGCGRSGRFSRRHCLHVTHRLPALLFRQKAPGWHSIVFVAFGDEPENFARSHTFQFSVNQRRHVSRPLQRSSMAGKAVPRVHGFAGIDRACCPAYGFFIAFAELGAS